LLFILNFDTIYSELFYIWCLLMKIKVKNRSIQDMSHMGSYLNSFLPYAQKRMGFNRPPTIFFDSDTQNADKILGKTGYYNPETDEIVVYVDKRHPKDILRSLSHELVHHTQNCRGDLEPEIAGETSPGYAQSNSHMRNMESEAYELGSGLYFRDWEDSLKNQLEETNYKHITGDTHKMATYDQLKEEITAKVVAALTEKLKNPKKADLDKDGKLSGYEKKRGAAIEKAMANQNESVEEVNEEEELEERKKRDTPRDSDRREDVKLKINEEEEELEEITIAGGGGDREEEEELDEIGAQEPYVDGDREDDDESGPVGEELNPIDALGDREEEEDLEETISNDEWYQNQLFESLTKKWAK
jgi:hypothetical protein